MNYVQRIIETPMFVSETCEGRVEKRKVTIQKLIVMKARSLFSKSLAAAITLLVTMSFASCSSDSDTVAVDAAKTIETIEKTTGGSFSLKLQALSDGTDITTKGQLSAVTLFVFDEGNDFVQQINVDKATILNRRTIDITCNGSDRITVVAWGGLDNVQVSPLSVSNIISDLSISLKSNKGIAVAPGDVFFGQVTLARQTKSDVTTMSVERKVSSVDLSISGVADHFGDTEGEFYVKVKSSKSMYDHTGNLSGELVEYIVPAYVTANGVLKIDKTSIFPASQVELELYKDDNLVFAVSKDKNGNTLSAEAGKQVSVQYNLSRTSYTVHVASYGTVVQFV